jgi:uncharacterized membrane-anchored protein YitT (DUF2179 family)
LLTEPDTTLSGTLLTLVTVSRGTERNEFVARAKPIARETNDLLVALAAGFTPGASIAAFALAAGSALGASIAALTLAAWSALGASIALFAFPARPALTALVLPIPLATPESHRFAELSPLAST